MVVLEDQIYLYDISNMRLLFTIETSPNPHGKLFIPESQKPLTYPYQPSAHYHPLPTTAISPIPSLKKPFQQPLHPLLTLLRLGLIFPLQTATSYCSTQSSSKPSMLLRLIDRLSHSSHSTQAVLSLPPLLTRVPLSAYLPSLLLKSFINFVAAPCLRVYIACPSTLPPHSFASLPPQKPCTSLN